MEYAVTPKQNGQGMSAGAIAGIALGAFVLGFVLLNVPDIIRYIRMSSM